MLWSLKSRFLIAIYCCFFGALVIEIAVVALFRITLLTLFMRLVDTALVIEVKMFGNDLSAELERQDNFYVQKNQVYHGFKSSPQ